MLPLPLCLFSLTGKRRNLVFVSRRESDRQKIAVSTTYDHTLHKRAEIAWADHVWIIMLMLMLCDNKHLAFSCNVFYFFILLNFFGGGILTNATLLNSRFSLCYTKPKWATVAEWWHMCMKHGPHSILQGQIIIAKDEWEEFPEVTATPWPEAFSAWLTYLLLFMLYTVYSLYIMTFTTAITQNTIMQHQCTMSLIFCTCTNGMINKTAIFKS